MSVPQLIAEFGLPAVQRVAPGLTAYYTETFADACTEMSESERYEDNAGKVDDIALIARVGNNPVVRAPSDQVKSSKSSCSADGIVDQIGALYLAQHGEVTLKENDSSLAGKLSLPTGLGSFDITDPGEKRAYEKKMGAVRKAVKAAYDSGAMPEYVSTDMLRGFVLDVTAAAGAQNGRALKKTIANSTGNFMRDAKRKDLEDRVAGGEKLGNREIAELALIRSEDQVWTAANPGATPPPHPEYDAGKHGKLVDFMQQKLDETFTDTPELRRKAGLLMNDPVTFNNFIEAQKNALVTADRGLRADGDKVKIDKNRSKRAWYAALQGLAA